MLSCLNVFHFHRQLINQAEKAFEKGQNKMVQISAGLRGINKILEDIAQHEVYFQKKSTDLNSTYFFSFFVQLVINLLSN